MTPINFSKFFDNLKITFFVVVVEISYLCQIRSGKIDFLAIDNSTIQNVRIPRGDPPIFLCHLNEMILGLCYLRSRRPSGFFRAHPL